MKRTLFLLLVLLSCLPFMAKDRGKELAEILQKVIALEEVHPDSIFPSLRMLERQRLEARTPQERVMYSTVLGRFYFLRQYRSQSRFLRTSSPKDSIEEWSREDYRKASRERFSEALSDMDLLFSMPTRQWAPLVERGKDEAVFGRNMLYVVWRVMRESGGNENVENAPENPLPTYADMIAYYKAHGLREAAFFMELDSVAEGSWLRRKADLQRITDEYADLTVSAKAMQQLIMEHVESAGWSDKQYSEYRFTHLTELLKKYPRYKDRGGIRNEILRTKTPDFWFDYQELVCTGQDAKIPFSYRNLNKLNFTLYLMPEGLDEHDLLNSKDQSKWLRKHALAVQQFEKSDLVGKSPFELFRDTLRLSVKEHGHYALLAETQTPMKLTQKAGQCMILLRASRLLPIQTYMNDKVRLTVVDALSGEPRRGVEVQVECEPTTSRLTDTLHLSLQTDERGIVDVPLQPNRRNYATFRLGEDKHYPRLSLSGYGAVRSTNEPTYHHANVYTDRAIYRPGQTIEVMGLLFEQEGWDAHTKHGEKVSLKFHDPDYKTLVDTMLVVDELGCISLSLPVSASAKLGTYRIDLDGNAKYVSVEEYKRPTFEVTMDKPTPVMGSKDASGQPGKGTSGNRRNVGMPSIAPDSITFTGRALTYAGVPVRKARVTGEFRWSEGWLKRYMYQSSTLPMKIDTLWTDDDGRFTVNVSNTLSASELLWGRWVTLSVDVLSSSGEAHSAQASASVCSTPLRLHAEMEDLQDKQHPTVCEFGLIDALGNNVDAPVKVTLSKYHKDTHVHEADYTSIIPSNTPTLLHGLKDGLLLSGVYKLTAQAVVNGDTATYKRDRIVVFSMDDEALPVDTACWFYMPVDTFTVGRPARIQVGSSLENVTVYYMLNAQGKLLTDTLFTLSNAQKTLSIPYEECMSKGASVSLYFVKDNQLYARNFDLHPLQPDYRLKTQWTTFRDRLRPGQHETWSLKILRPDGKPATANLLATLYDASLDALRRHNMNLNVLRGYNIYVFRPYANLPYRKTANIYYPLKMFKEYAWAFSGLDNSLFFPPRREGKRAAVDGGAMIRNARLMKTGALAVLESEIAFSTKGISVKDFEELGITSVDEALQGRIAGLDIVDNSTELGTGAVMRLRGTGIAEENQLDDETPADWSALRTNFSETAFFMPQLRTDTTGTVVLDFTLPESLTRWHLLGLAHTQDMLTAQLDESVVAQKELMAQLFLPRFLRVGDKAVLTAIIQNIKEKDAPSTGTSSASPSTVIERGTAVFELLDARTEKVVLRKKVSFSLLPKQDTVFYFPYDVRDADMDLICRWVANGSSCSDGEQRLLPVLSDRETITRTKAITLNGQGTTDYDLQQLFPRDASNRHLTVEYTTHPVWCAIQALPSLFKTTHEDVLSLVSSYYASTLCLHFSKSVSGIDQVIDLRSDSLEVLRARVMNKVKDLQLPDGSIAWFSGMMGSNYLTLETAFQLTRLKVLTGKLDSDADEMLRKAIGYLRRNLSKNSHISNITLRHLYIASMSGKSLDDNEKRLLKELSKTPEGWTLEEKALAAIVLHQQEKNRATNRMLDGVEKYLVGTPETGRYIDYPSGSFTSIDRKIHIHTQIMEAMMMVRPEAQEMWKGMRQWLLQEKRTTDWTTPINTIDAVYALLSAGREDLTDEAQDVLDVKGRGQTQRLTSPDTRKGYLKQEVDLPSPQKLSIHKRSQGESWGAVYAQFEQQIDSVNAAWQGINIRREISKLHPEVGDRIHVRYVISATKDYEYVLLHAPRPAATEPAQPVSGYAYSNGLGYYRTVKDSATDYYISSIPKGTYVLEEDVMVEREGVYSAGVTTVECLYAPEFRAHTTNLKINSAR